MEKWLSVIKVGFSISLFIVHPQGIKKALSSVHALFIGSDFSVHLIKLLCIDEEEKGLASLNTMPSH